MSLRNVCLALGLVFAVWSTACSATKSGPRDQYRMGEKVQAGPLIYTVLETQWKSQLGELLTATVPNNRFLLVKISVTNSGGSEVMVPSLSLEDAGGRSYPEVSDGRGVPQWLGLLRRVSPAQTEQGNVAFDVPTAAYKLRLSDPNDLDRDKGALV